MMTVAINKIAPYTVTKADVEFTFGKSSATKADREVDALRDYTDCIVSSDESPKRDAKIIDIVVDLHLRDWCLFSSWYKDDRFGKQNLESYEQLVFEKLVAFLSEHTPESVDDIKLCDGAKKTVIVKSAQEVLKIYPTRGVYDTEKSKYDIINKAGATCFFVPQYAWDDESRTARSAMCIPAKDDGARGVKILESLQKYGLTMGDLDYGDNIGYLGDKYVVFDIKSLRRI